MENEQSLPTVNKSTKVQKVASQNDLGKSTSVRLLRRKVIQFSSSYDVLSSTVGLDKLRSLENCCSTEEDREDFKLLFKIYQKLQDSTKHQVSEVTEGDISEVSSLEKSMTLPTTSSTLTEAESILQNTLFSKVPQAASLHSMSSTSSTRVAPVISDYNEIFNLKITHSSEVNTSTETVSIASDKNSTEGIYQYLQWPKTPERKSLRQTKKLPYVIASTG
nr:unnamed protein product [Callosobruchus analis]